MDETPDSNYDFENADIFRTFNPYFLLFFSLSCILSSVFLQELFIIIKQFRLGITIAPALGIIGPIFVLTRRFPSGFRQQLRIHAPRPALTTHVVLATLASIIVIDHLYIFSQQIMPEPVDYIESLKGLRSNNAWTAAVTFVGLCIVVPVAEESVFRGVIQQVFGRNMNPTLTVVLTGVFFGVIHLNPQLLLSMMCFGIFLSYVFYVTSNLTYTIISHAVLNTVAFLQLTLTTDDSMHSAPFYVLEYWSLAVALLFLGFFVVKIKRGGSKPEDSP